MDAETKEYKQLVQMLEQLYTYLEQPWGGGTSGARTRKQVGRTTAGIVEQMRPYLNETYVSWLQENTSMIRKLVDTEWEGRGKHTRDLKKIRNIINHTKLVFDKDSNVFGPCKRF